MKILGRISCSVRQQHSVGPMRMVIRDKSAFPCVRCGATLLDLDEAGYGSGYIDPLRRLYQRRNGEFTRTSSWEAEQGVQ